MDGQRFGRLVVLSREPSNARGDSQWRCRCDCGREVVTVGGRLRMGGTKSCGCLQKEKAAENAVIARAAFQKHLACDTAEYRAWGGMRQRCNNPRVRQYPNYGGRGIKVCERWKEFANFIADMGKRPGPAYSVDRIDVNGDYEPGNCRWATQIEQNNNTRANHRVVCRGEEMTVSQAIRKFAEVPVNTVWSRLGRGWSIEQALG